MSKFRRTVGGNGPAWPLPNVWVGVSVENQEQADKRIPDLLATPAAGRWLSCEPLLGLLNLSPWLSGIKWVVIGGESGLYARTCNVAWVRSLVQQCQKAGVACFVKQLGSNQMSSSGKHSWIQTKGGNPSEWPEDLRVREYPHV